MAGNSDAHKEDLYGDKKFMFRKKDDGLHVLHKTKRLLITKNLMSYYQYFLNCSSGRILEQVNWWPACQIFLGLWLPCCHSSLSASANERSFMTQNMNIKVLNVRLLRLTAALSSHSMLYCSCNSNSWILLAVVVKIHQLR